MTGLRIITIVAVACASLSTVATAHAETRTAAAQAGVACKSYNVHRYPGSTLSRLRYGEVVFTVFLCPTQNASSWAPSTRDPTTNATGKNLGFALLNSSIRATQTGQNKWNRFARYEGTFTSETCVPWVGKPCKGTGDWKVRFTITADKKSHVVHIFPQSVHTPDGGFTLYTTP